MPEGSKGIAILLLLALVVAGVIIAFNIGDFLGIGFNHIHDFRTGTFIILARIVGLILIGLPIYVIVEMLRN